MTIEERIATLERELAKTRQRNRGLWTAIAGIIVGVLALTLSTESKAQTRQSRGVGNVVRASRFIVEDDKGTPCVELSSGESGPRLELLMDGKERAAMVVNEDGASLVLRDNKGKLRTLVSVDKSGPMLSLHDESAKPRAQVGVAESGPSLLFTDERGKPRAGLEVRAEGPVLAFIDEKNEVRAKLDVREFGPTLLFNDERGKSRAVLVVVKDGPRLLFSDEKGALEWGAP